MIKDLIVLSLKNKFSSATKNEIKYALIAGGLITAFLIPYISIQFQFILALILVTIALILGSKKWGLLALSSELILLILNYFSHHNSKLIELVCTISTLVLLTFSLDLVLESAAELISKSYASQQKLKKQKKELDFLYQHLNEEITKARKLHHQFLPENLPDTKEITFGSYYQPSKNLGGDFYNTIEVNDQIIFFVSDVRGHSLDGALTNIFLRENINNYLLHDSENDVFSPKEIMNYIVKKYQQESFPNDHFISLLLGVINLNKMEISFSNAGFQVPPLVISSSHKVIELNQGGLPISSVTANNLIFEMDSFDYTEEKIKLTPEKTICITTDGLVEETVNNQQYGLKKIKKIISEYSFLPPEFLVNHLIKDFYQFTNDLHTQDDITLLAIKRNKIPIANLEKEITSTPQEIDDTVHKIIEFTKEYLKKSNNLDLRIALHEILINSLEHGNSDRYQKIQIIVNVTAQYIKVTITDQGTGFNWKKGFNQSLDLSDLELTNLSNDRGRGIQLTNTAIDYLWYNNQGNQAYILKLRATEEE